MTSQTQYIPHLCDWVVNAQPQTILDVGIGYGRNGLLCRECSEVWGCNNNVEPTDWMVRIDGIEPRAEYINEWQRDVYSKLYQGDPFEILPELPLYDLVVMTEFAEPDLHKAMEAIKHVIRLGKRFLITVPRAGSGWDTRHLLPYGKVKSFTGSIMLTGDGQR